LVASTALAAPELRVGFVDLQKALSSSSAGQEAQKKYDAQVSKAKTSVEDKKKELDGLKESYKKQSASLNDKARQAKEEEILNHEKDLKRSLQDSQEKLRKENMQLVSDLVKRIRAVVADVGKEEGFTMIFEKSSQSVLYADSSIDITESVIKKFNESN
jgi:outer membrane protein